MFLVFFCVYVIAKSPLAMLKYHKFNEWIALVKLSVFHEIEAFYLKLKLRIKFLFLYFLLYFYKLKSTKCRAELSEAIFAYTNYNRDNTLCLLALITYLEFIYISINFIYVFW